MEKQLLFIFLKNNATGKLAVKKSLNLYLLDQIFMIKKLLLTAFILIAIFFVFIIAAIFYFGGGPSLLYLF